MDSSDTTEDGDAFRPFDRTPTTPRDDAEKLEFIAKQREAHRKRRNRSVQVYSCEDLFRWSLPKLEDAITMSEGRPDPSDEEVINLARDAVKAAYEDNRDADISSIGAVRGQPRGHDTIDFRYKKIRRLPDEVVDIIKDGLERCGKVPMQRLSGLALAHNALDALPLRLSECTRLRYLNLRNNFIREFPPAILKLTALDVLDLKSNLIQEIPEEIANLTSLKYLVLEKNKIERLPLGIGELRNLQILRLDGNPLRFPPPEVFFIAGDGKMPTAEREQNITQHVKGFLRQKRSNRNRLRIETETDSRLIPLFLSPDLRADGKIPPTPARVHPSYSLNQSPLEQSPLYQFPARSPYLLDQSRPSRNLPLTDRRASESNVETPRPQRSRFGGRFPVKPSISSMEAFADPKAKSPGPPPIPDRSHARVQSQQNALTRRPPVTPLAITNERNRSHSEGAGSVNVRAKRMGMVTRKASDLARVDESLLKDSNHLRGGSYGSAFPPQLDTNVPSTTGPVSAGDAPRQKPLFTRPLSDVMEHKPWSEDYDRVVNALRMNATSTIDFLVPAEALLHSVNVPSQLALVNCYEQTQNTVDIVQGLFKRYDALAEEEEDLADQLFDQMLQHGTSLIDLHIEFVVLLNENAEDIARYCDDPGVRRLFQRLVNAQYLNAVDARNASTSLGMVFNEPNEQVNRDKHRSDRSTTPTQSWPNPSDSRMALSPQYTPQYDANSSIPNTPRNYTGSSPLQTGNTLRANTISSSLAATPRSGESFATIGTVSMSRTNTGHGQPVDESDEEGLFEGIWQKLSNACKLTMQTLPSCQQKFIEAYNVALRDPDPTKVSVQRWSRVTEKSSAVHHAAFQLNQTLKSIKLRDAEFRSSQHFWQLCTTYVKSWSDLASAVKEIGQLGQIPDDIKSAMKPIQRAVKDASVAITTSPWSHLAVRGEGPSSFAPGSATSQGYHSGHPSDASSVPSFSSGSNYATNGSNYAANGYMGAVYASSGYTTVPATPLSAALGAAAQATVPSTPGHSATTSYASTTSHDGPLTGAFSGNVFERADRYLAQTRRRI